MSPRCIPIDLLTVSDDVNQDTHHTKIVIMTVATFLGRVDFVAMILVGLNFLKAC
jgi:hypothetical protein